MKKTIALILVMLLSITIFASDIAGITMIVRAGDYSEDGGDHQDSEDEDDPVPEPTDAPAPEPDPTPTPTPEPDPDDDPAAREAAKKAEEEAEDARKAAEDAAKQAEEDDDDDYSLMITMNGSPVSSVDFGTAAIGEQRDYIEISVTNTGANAFDLITTKNGDADGAFSLTFKGDMTHYDPGDSGKLNLSMREDLKAGTYKALFLFGAQTDPTFSEALGLWVNGTVSPRSSGVSSVEISPAHVVVSTGSTWQFSADVRGIGEYDHSVLWSLSGGSGGTGIDNNGLLTVDPNDTATNLTVIASSAADPSIKDTASVDIQKGSFNVATRPDPADGGKIYGGGAVSRGGSVTVSAIPNGNYVFKGWVIDGKSLPATTNYTISNINANVDVVAKFERNTVTVRLDVSDPDGGKVSGAGTYNCGDTATITAKANPGYAFTGWTENGNTISRDNQIQLKNLTVDRKLKAEFRKTKYTVNLVVNPSNAGDVSCGGTFDLGDSTTVRANARSGYDFTGWYINGQAVSRDSEYRIGKIEQDYTLTANFQQQGTTTYEISSGVATTGGSITPCGKIYAPKGSNLTYTITPKVGFAILAVAVDGSQIGPVSTYTFTNITAAHSIAAAFVQTDAGKKAAEASGVKTQDSKVQVIPKTESNTATKTSTISINEAANGEGGDNYVEEMDLSGIHVPSD
ncbi:MAG: InlB B-repeat-containing protein, partial [Lachnospiraceae bacterium]|nr:InlB B-repeat-containing protein [Lachnospiraceae bacterium]